MAPQSDRKRTAGLVQWGGGSNRPLQGRCSVSMEPDALIRFTTFALSLAERRKRHALWLMGVVDHRALVAEDHGGPLVQVKLRPVGQPLVGGIPAAREGGPRPAHLRLKRVAVPAAAGHRLGLVHVFQ